MSAHVNSVLEGLALQVDGKCLRDGSHDLWQALVRRWQLEMGIGRFCDHKPPVPKRTLLAARSGWIYTLTWQSGSYFLESILDCETRAL